MSFDSNSLIDGILSEANKKADAILLDAKKEAKSIIEKGEEDALLKAEEEKRNTNIRLESFRLKEESAKRNIDRLEEIKKMDLSYNLVMDRVNEKFQRLSESGEIREYLVSWIAEASIGLDKRSALVSFSPKAVVDDAMLRDAERIVKEKTGSDLSLSLDEKRFSEIGVIVTSEDRKISYNNLLSTRIRRYAKDIRKIIQEENAR